MQAAADSLDKVVERILFEASLKQRDFKKATLTRIGHTFTSIQEHVPGYFRGLGGQCIYLCQVLEVIGTDKILDGKDTHWYSSMHHAFEISPQALDHVYTFIYLFLDLLNFDSEKRMRLDTRNFLCPRLPLILQSTLEEESGYVSPSLR